MQKIPVTYKILGLVYKNIHIIQHLTGKIDLLFRLASYFFLRSLKVFFYIEIFA